MDDKYCYPGSDGGNDCEGIAGNGKSYRRATIYE